MDPLDSLDMGFLIFRIHVKRIVFVPRVMWAEITGTHKGPSCSE